jgi:hypothetical protein
MAGIKFGPNSSNNEEINGVYEIYLIVGAALGT